MLFHLRLSDVMYKQYERLVYKPSDLLARFIKQTCQTEKIPPDLLSKYFFFPGLIYCNQEPLWPLNVIEDDCYFLGVHIKAKNSM